jgi:hypothetical protein
MRKHSILIALAIAAAGFTHVFSPTPAAADVVTHKCGKPVSSIVKTQLGLFSTNSTTFENLPGSTTTVDVGDGGCVKVRLFAEMRCSETANNDICTFRVVEPGVAALDPPLNGVTFIGEGGQTGYSTHSFAWVGEFGPGKHKIAVQAGVQNAATTMEVQAWTLEIEVTK